MEETFSEPGTSHKINGIAIQRAFPRLLLKVNRVKIRKSRKQSTEAPMDKIYVNKAGHKTDSPQSI